MDIRMNYIEKGEGKPLIMIHGNEDVCQYFEKQLDYFAERGYHCIAPDSRAHGKTPRGIKPLTIRQMAQDVVDFMDEQGIDKADFIGFSDGGNIMLVMALAHPERINKMVVYGANLFLEGIEPETVDWIMAEYNEALAKADSIPSAKLKMELLRLMVNDPNIDPEELTEIKLPTLVLAGTEDLILKEHTEFIASKIEGAELAFVRGTHFCASENPEEFNTVVYEFLKN
ncbi:MAG: alpha/beta hydrolase [Firmicutes bacterium]|nr:alpha/beta hydrolase [Bacillota bacterium]